MSQLEDVIRESLRSQAGRLHEAGPLRLPSSAAAHPRLRRALRPRPWFAPVAAAAAVVLIAAGLVTAKTLHTDATANAAASSAATVAASSGFSPVKAAAGTPRYYLYNGWSKPGPQGNWTISAGDARTGKTIGSYNLPKGDTITWAASGAADDRTFVVEAGVFTDAQHPVIGAPRWYLVRLFPGSPDPVRVTSLPVAATAVTAIATDVISVALSADATELAVVYNTGKEVGLSDYSVATGRLQSSWSIPDKGVGRVQTPVTDPSWVGDHTVAFDYIITPNAFQQVRTLNTSSPGGGTLLTDALTVWTQHITDPGAKNAPRTCDTPFLTADKQAVVCANGTDSAKDGRWTALWLAYPLATPDRPRVIGRVTEPAGVSGFNGPNSVEWVNESGTEVFGLWNPETKVKRGTSVNNYHAFIGGGKIREVYLFSPPVTW